MILHHDAGFIRQSTDNTVGAVDYQSAADITQTSQKITLGVDEEFLGL
jgi:hypothetical protein